MSAEAPTAEGVLDFLIRSIVEEPGRIVRVRRHSATKRRARSSFDVAASASRAIHSRKSRAPRPEKER